MEKEISDREVPSNFSVSVLLQKKNGKPAIELRTLTTDPEIIRTIVSSAFQKKPIVVFPVFRDEVRASCKLVQNGILSYDKDKEVYNFII